MPASYSTQQHCRHILIPGYGGLPLDLHNFVSWLSHGFLFMSLLVSAIDARAKPEGYDVFINRYPSWVNTGHACAVCHYTSDANPSSPRNQYGIDWNTELSILKTDRNCSSGPCLTQARYDALGLIEDMDSDNDGSCNLNEITAGTLPGNASSKPTNGVVDISVAQRVDPPSWVVNGDSVTFTITVTNIDTGDAATGVDLTASSLDHLGYLSAVPSQGSCSVSPAVVDCSLGTIAAGGSATIPVTATTVVAHGVERSDVSVFANETNSARSETSQVFVTELPAPIGLLSYEQVRKDGDISGNDFLADVRSIAFSPDGAHAYVASHSDDAVTMFVRSASTGDLFSTPIAAYRDGVGGVDGLDGASAIAISADGHYVYVASDADNAVAMFSRDHLSGELTFRYVYKDGVDGVDGLAGARSIALSPDGRHIYTASRYDSAVAVFDRDEASGQLLFKQVLKQGGESGRPGVAIDGLQNASSLVVSPDGNSVYVASKLSSAVTTFRRDITSGELVWYQTIKSDMLDMCNGVDGLYIASSVAISPDSANVYVASANDASIAVFERPNSYGLLKLKEVLKQGINGVDGLVSPNAITVSPDGAHVYVASLGDQVAAFARDLSSGRLTFIDVEKDGVSGVDGLNGAFAITLSPDGKHVYVGARDDDSVAVFQRSLAADLEVTQTAFPQPAIVGQNITYRVQVTNNGPTIANDVEFTDILPPGMIFQYAITDPTDDGYCTGPASGTLTCFLGSTKLNETETVDIVVQAQSTSAYSNTVSVSASAADPIPYNNDHTLPIDALEQVPAPTFTYPTGGTILQPGDTATVTWDTNGAPVKVTLSDDMESSNVFWIATHDGSAGGFDWVRGTGGAHSGSYKWFAEDPATISDQYLATAGYTRVPVNGGLSFWHSYNTEPGYDGGVVEISTDGATWTDLGTVMVRNGYNSTIPTAFGSPIGGRSAFSGNSDVYVQTLVDLRDYSGLNAFVRFRMASDSSVASGGWYVDDVALLDATSYEVAYTSNCSSSSVTWVPIGTTIGSSLSWNVPSIVGDDYCLKIEGKANNYVTSSQVISALFTVDLDSDGDGLSDTIDPNPNNVDSDNDGLVDGAGGVVPLSVLPTGIDTDGDGFVDGEQDHGTNPVISNRGDLAPRGAPDNLINVGDLLVLTRLVTGVIQPTGLEPFLGDLNGDTQLDTPDVLLLQKALLNGTPP